MTTMAPDYSKYRVNVKLEKYDFDRMQKYVGEGKDFSNASVMMRYALIRLLDRLEDARQDE